MELTTIIESLGVGFGIGEAIANTFYYIILKRNNKSKDQPYLEVIKNLKYIAEKESDNKIDKILSNTSINLLRPSIYLAQREN